MARSGATAQIKEDVCPQCGGKVAQKAKFCTHCGYKLSAAGTPLAFPKVSETREERKAKDTILARLKELNDPLSNPEHASIDDLFTLITQEAVPFGEIQEFLLPLLEHPYRPLREKVAGVLVSDELGRKKFLELLNDDRNWVRSTVIRALGRGKVASVVPTLMFLFDSEDDIWVRRDILFALGEIKEIQAFNLLMRALMLEESELVSAAAQALTVLGDPAAVKYLIPQLSHKDHQVVHCIEDALHSFGKQSVQPLLAVFGDVRTPPLLKKKILGLIINIPDPMAAPLLINALAEQKDLAVDLMKVMAAWKFPEFIPALQQITESPERTLRIAALGALRQFGS